MLDDAFKLIVGDEMFAVGRFATDGTFVELFKNRNDCFFVKGMPTNR